MKRTVLLLIITTVNLNSAVAQSSPTAQAKTILPIQNSRGINQTYLRPIPLGPLLDPGTACSDWQLLIQNEFRSSFNVYEDGETWRLHLTRRFATERGEWQLSLPLIHRGGGIADPFIDWWHKNIANHRAADRERTPHGQHKFRLSDGTQLNAGTGFGDLKLSYSFRSPGQPQISIKLPTGNPSLLLGSGGLDLGLSAEGTWQLLPRIRVTTHGSLVYQSPSTLWSGTHPWIPSFTIAISYSPSSRQTWIVQLNSEASPLANRQPYLDQTNRMITLGYSQVTKNGTWTYWLSEDGDVGQFNLNGNVNVAADLSIGIQFSQKR